MQPNQNSVAPHYPLCIDLDGTLIKSDLLYESLLKLVSTNPLYVFVLPFWLLLGKARFKHKIASIVPLEPATLPYDARVLALVEACPARPRVLCTASDQHYAQSISAYLGFFEDVIASDGNHNLAGESKAHALVDRFGESKFDYAGNSKADVAVWAKSRNAIVVNANDSLAKRAAMVTNVSLIIPNEPVSLKAWLKAIRVHQWLKNLLVFVPLAVGHALLVPSAVIATVAAFFAFSLCASGVYVLNDLLDLDADRLHPRKRKRPFASGTIPILQGVVATIFLTIFGLVLALSVNTMFALVLAAYYIITLAYSLLLKRRVMIDVVTLASLYTMRIIGGSLAIANTLSFWLLAFSMFIFLSLALLKRYTELADALANGSKQPSGRGYDVGDLSMIQSLGAASGYIAVLVLALYINSPESLKLYSRPQLIWLLCPLLLYWISRVWIIAHRGKMHDDPIVFAVSDRISQIIVGLGGLISFAAL